MATRPVPPLHPLRGPGRPMLAAAIFLVCSLVAASTALATMRLQKPAASKPSTGRTIPPRTDHDGEPLPPGALARLGSRRYRVSWVLCQVAFSPDGRRLAAACDGVRMFDRATGRLLWHAAK
ncbi:MAG TPA: hypothetical protein VFA18_17595, partial [Gemmataceae bacterium]|nr:hypothetical protein [Gemmataceae bacterium]